MYFFHLNVIYLHSVLFVSGVLFALILLIASCAFGYMQ